MPPDGLAAVASGGGCDQRRQLVVHADAFGEDTIHLR